MNKKLAIGRAFHFIGGTVMIVAFFFGLYVKNKNAEVKEYLAPGEFFLKLYAPYFRSFEIFAERSLSLLPHLFGLLLIVYAVLFIWKRQKVSRLVYVLNYFFTIAVVTMILHNISTDAIKTPPVYKLFFWSAFVFATMATVLIHLGLNRITKSDNLTTLAVQLMMGIGGLTWFMFLFVDLKSLEIEPPQQPIGLYLALGAYFFCIVGTTLLYLVEIDRAREEQARVKKEAEEKKAKDKEDEAARIAAKEAADAGVLPASLSGVSATETIADEMPGETLFDTVADGMAGDTLFDTVSDDTTEPSDVYDVSPEASPATHVFEPSEEAEGAADATLIDDDDDTPPSSNVSEDHAEDETIIDDT